MTSEEKITGKQNYGPAADSARRQKPKNPLLALLLGWVVPGLGHVYSGNMARGIVFFLLLTGSIFTGYVISDGEAVDLALHEIACIGQAGAGGPVLGIIGVKYFRARKLVAEQTGGVADFAEIKSYREKTLIDEYRTRGHINTWSELGLLLATLAGFLNFLVAIDAAESAANVSHLKSRGVVMKCDKQLSGADSGPGDKTGAEGGA